MGHRVRLLLIDPPFYRFMGYYSRYFPYGLAALASAARALGHEPVVYDADQDPHARDVDYQGLPQRYGTYLAHVADPTHGIWREFRAVVTANRPQWVGITALTAKMASVLQAASLVRAACPRVPIVVGGPHAMVRPREVLANAPEVDAVVVGEGEPLLRDILVEDREALRATRGLPGLVTRACDEVSEAPPADLAALPPVDRLSFVRGPASTEDLGLVMTSRGCPYGCSYCFRGGLWRRKVRFVPLETLEEELSGLKRRGVRHVTFKDDVFTLHRERTEAVCDLVARLGMTWDCVTRADRIDEALLARMRRAGCTGIKIGVETGSRSLMRRLDRTMSLELVREACGWLRRAGLHWTAYFMMGLPGESLDDVECTMRLLQEVRPDFASLSGYEAFPGTALFDEALEAGIVKETMGRDEFFRTSPHDYYFLREDRGMILPPDLSYPALESAMHARVHRYNAAFPRLLKRVRARMGVWKGQPSIALHDAARFLAWMGRRGTRG